MAEEIAIGITADISDITAQIEKLPGISKEEADKMAKNIKKGLKETEAAAKKAAATNVKAMKKVEQQNKRVDKSYRKLKRGASEMGRGLGEVASIVGSTDSRLGVFVDTIAMASISVSAMIPLLSGAASKIKTMGAAVAMSAGPIGLLGAGLGLVAYKLGTTVGQFAKMRTEQILQQQEAKLLATKLQGLAKTYDSLSDSMQAPIRSSKELLRSLDFRSYTESTIGYSRELIDLQMDLDVATGKMSELTAARNKLAKEQYLLQESEEERIKNLYKTQKENLEKNLRDVESNYAQLERFALNYYNQYYQAQDDGNKAALDATFDTERKKIQAAIDGRFAMTALGKKFSDDLLANEKTIQELRDRLDPTSGAFYAKEEKTEIESTKKLIADIRDIKEKTIIAEDKRKKQDEAKKRAAQRISELEKQIADSKKSTGSLEKENLQTAISQATETQKIIDLLKEKENLEVGALQAQIDGFAVQKQNAIALAKTEKEKNLAKELGLLLDAEALEIENKIALTKSANAEKIAKLREDSIVVAEETYDLEKMRLRELYALESELRNASSEAEKEKHAMIIEQIRQREAEQRQAMSSLIGNVEGFFAARMQIMQNSGQAERDAIVKTFYMQQAASMANVAMQTAENIIAAQSLLPPTGPILAASYVALGAAQMGAIMSQKPPASRHMGGMANDEMNYRLLTGEAVLSRQAVRNMGGEQVLKSMERGQGSGGDVIILQPFKHFDRYLNQRNRRKARRASNGSY